jgi:hypothetical protein
VYAVHRLSLLSVQEMRGVHPRSTTTPKGDMCWLHRALPPTSLALHLLPARCILIFALGDREWLLNDRQTPNLSITIRDICIAVRRTCCIASVRLTRHEPSDCRVPPPPPPEAQRTCKVGFQQVKLNIPKGFQYGP